MKKNNLFIIFISIMFVFISSGVEASDAPPEGKDLARDVHDYHMGENSLASMTMELVDKNGRSRMRSLITMTMDQDNVRSSLIRFLEPADIAGTGFLSLEQGDGDTQQFLYLPALDRTRRIVATQKGRSFVNSDFTYEDMERRPVEESDHELSGQEMIDGRECWILEIRPLPVAESQYSLLRSWIPKDSPVPVQTYFYDEGGAHIKTYKVHELERIQEIWTPVHVVMTDLVQDHETILITQEIEYNSPRVQPSIFTTRYLESW